MTRLVAITMLVVACGGGPGGADPATSSSACAATFVTAAGVDELADSVSDLYPAVRACGSLAEWTAAFDAVGGAGFSGAAEEVLRNACLADEVASEPLCVLVQ